MIKLGRVFEFGKIYVWEDSLGLHGPCMGFYICLGPFYWEKYLKKYVGSRF